MADAKKVEDKAPTKIEDAKPLYEVGQVLTPEGLAAMRAELEAKLASEIKSDPTFSDPNAATKLGEYLHSTLSADIAQDLKGAEVPKGAVAMYCAQDQRVTSESGHVFLFPANTVQHIPAAFVGLCKKFGCAEAKA